MTEKSRREFLWESSLTAAGALVALPASADENPLPDGSVAPHHHGKTPPRRVATIRSTKSGKWSDAGTWGGRAPKPDDIALVAKGHVVQHDVDRSTTVGIEVATGGTLEFDPRGSSTLECRGNIVVEGTLRLRPVTADCVHTIRFADVDEKLFVGGGMDPLDSDVGLWIIGAGELDLMGAAKSGWTRAVGPLKQGLTRANVQDAKGWQIGDTLVIVPTETPPADSYDWDDANNLPLDRFAAKFERRMIIAIDGNDLTLDEPLAHDHLAVESDTGKTWTAELANLTRNVRIEGTSSGRAHIFIRSSATQRIHYVEGRHLGPRNVQKGHRRPQLVLGRYALHFHHCYEGSRASIVEGCALYDVGNRVYVPHMSHGITMRDNVSFNSMEAGFWWDFQEVSHDTSWERNLVALVMPNGIDSSSLGMMLNQGDGNVARNNVVVYGHHGDHHGHGGYVWDADSEGVWTFENNLSHSNRTGLFVWQNTSLNHTIVNQESYNDYLGIFHGAYANSYTYTGGHMCGSIVRVKATSGNASGVRFEQMTFDGAGQVPYCVDVYPSPVASELDANVFRQCNFRNAPVALLMNTFSIGEEQTRKHVDLITCEFSNIDSPTEFTKESTLDSVFRIQPARGKCSRIEHATGVAEIEPFAPYLYGTGVGLTGRYFNGTNFDKLAFTRIDSMIMFQQWSYDKAASPTGVHHAITGDEYSVRWIGKIEPQFSLPYKFFLRGSAGFRLWIDDRVAIDAWSERADNSDLVESAPFELIAGRKYDIRLDTFNDSGSRGCQLYWECHALGRMVHVPQSQLYVD